jgi:hypothetical protein
MALRRRSTAQSRSTRQEEQLRDDSGGLLVADRRTEEDLPLPQQALFQVRRGAGPGRGALGGGLLAGPPEGVPPRHQFLWGRIQSR